MARLTEEEFTKIIDQQVDEAASWQEEHIADERQRNYEMYVGKNRQPAPDGRSQVVTWDVFETIESALPDMIEIFLATDQVAAFDPVGEEDVQFAEQATDYINHILLKQNPGFLIFHNWVKDALIAKLGIVRAYWAESEKVTCREYTGVSEMQLTQLLQVEGADIEEQKATDDPAEVQRREVVRGALNTLDPAVRQQAQMYLDSPVDQIYDVTITITRKKGQIYIDNIQPENFIVTPRAKTLKSADIVGEMKMLTRSDMLEQGWKKSDVKEAQSYDTTIRQDGSIGDALFDDASVWGDYGFEEPDDATEKVEVFDGFVRCDYDGDGIAEWRHVVRAGNLLLVNDEADEPDFCTITPILIPHSLIGMALADPVAPLQETTTAMQRQYQDSLYLANNPRTYVNTAAGVNLADVLNNRIGGIVRGTQPMANAISPLVTTNVSESALRGIEFADTRREQRTGLTRHNQGLDADSLNKTARGMGMLMTAGDRRKLMMARIMAETGVKDLFRLLLKLVTSNQDKPATIRLRNEWVQYSPSEWSPEMDVTIETGLGTGDKTQLLGTLQGVLAIQKEAMAAGIPLAGPKQLYNTLAAIMKASGIKGIDKYFIDPESPQAQQQAQQHAQNKGQETPEMALAQAQVKAAELQLQGKQMQIQADAQEATQDLQAKLQMKSADLAMKDKELQIKQVELQIKQAELELKRAEATEKARIAEREQTRRDVETADRVLTPSQPAGFPA